MYNPHSCVYSMYTTHTYIYTYIFPCGVSLTFRVYVHGKAALMDRNTYQEHEEKPRLLGLAHV